MDKQLEDIIEVMDTIQEFDVNKTITDFSYEKVLNVLKLQGFKKYDSVNAKAFMEKKKLVYEIEDGKFLVLSVIYMPSLSIVYRMLNAVKTRSGIIYAERQKGHAGSAYMSHFFDRFAQRTGECHIIQRKKAIRRYLQLDEINTKIRVTASRRIDDDTKELLTLHSNGICLGVNYKKHWIYKTFVLNSMMTTSQVNVVEMLKKWNVMRERYMLLRSKEEKSNLLNTEMDELETISNTDMKIFDVEGFTAFQFVKSKAAGLDPTFR